MTKSLTEQWREGTLPEDCYYILDKNGHIKKERTCFYSHTDGQCFSFTDNRDIEAVLAPVPSYNEWKRAKENLDKNGTWYTERSHKELLKQTERLQEQLEIATKALEEYANCKPTEWLSCVTADKALKEMEGVK